MLSLVNDYLKLTSFTRASASIQFSQTNTEHVIGQSSYLDDASGTQLAAFEKRDCVA